MPPKPFYNHIAGLRGLAFILIFLFHINSTCFPHGFYGVDMFLVISGYLLFLSFCRNDYQLNLKEFASKKLLRIFPPMIILVVATILAAMYFQDYDDLVDTARGGRYTLFGFANRFLKSFQSDYFAADAVEFPLLHMWYLSVTIHLYVMFAIGCVVYRFIPRKLSFIILWVIGIASFCYAYSFQFHNILQALGVPVWEQKLPVSHYHTMPRVWTVLAGGAILLLPSAGNKVTGTILTLIGLLGALLPALAPNSLADYGSPAVVLGTMLIIRYMPDSILMPVLSNKPLLWIGGISFSLYLVHMPVISFYHIWYYNISSWSDYAIIIALSLLLGWLLWFLIEKRRINLYWTAGIWATTMVLCVLGKETEGFKDYLRPELNTINVTPYDEWKACEPGTLENEFNQKELRKNKSFLDLANTTRPLPPTEAMLLQMGPASKTPKVLLLGDSFGQAMYFGLNKLCGDLNTPGAFLCTTLVTLWDYHMYVNSEYCSLRGRNEAVMKWIEANPCITHVVLSQYWRSRYRDTFVHWDGSVEPMTPDLYYNALREYAKRIHDMGRHVIVIGPGPEIEMQKPTRYSRITKRKGITDIDLGPLSCTREDVDKLNTTITPILKKLEAEGLCTLIDARAIIPEDKPFISYENGIFYMFDRNHLSSEGSIRLFDILKPEFEKVFQQSRPGVPAGQ